MRGITNDGDGKSILKTPPTWFTVGDPKRRDSVLECARASGAFSGLVTSLSI